MIRQLIDAFAAHNDPAKLRAVIAKQRLIIDRLRKENAQLRHENRQLRRRLKDTELNLLRRAETDAYLIGALYFAQQSTSRRACGACGIGPRRWHRAIALLRVARIHDGRRIDEVTPEEFERAVVVGRQRVERDGLDVVRWRMPICYR